MLISHPAFKEYQRKPLTEHLLNVAQGCKCRIQRLSLATQLINKADLAELAFRIGLFHDLGKASSFFQAHILGGKSTAYTRHSLISALILYFNLYHDTRFEDFALLAFKAIERHHGNLSTLGSEGLDNAVLIETTLRIYEDIKQQISADSTIKEFMDTYRISLPAFGQADIKQLSFELELLEPLANADDAIERFLLQNLLFSVLVDADKYDAARIVHRPDQNLEQKLSYSPLQYLTSLAKEDNDLNKIRTKLLEAAADFQPKSTNCYAMSAPTGSGKTLACLGFTEALQQHCKHIRRVIYCLPYTSIIDQNFAEIARVFKANNLDPGNPDLLLKHHHLVDFSRQDPDENYDYHDYLNDNLLADSWNSACVVSTFVQLFHSLIGSRNSLVRKLHNIINSIILLDEVQSLPAKYYPLLRKVFAILAQRFDTHILTCTATQPFIFAPESYSEISPPGLFDHQVFNRVKLSIAREACTLADFVQNLDLQKADNALFVMNTKRSAIELYQMLKESYQDSYQLFCLTTYHTPGYRLKYISEIASALAHKQRILLVSTQLIEAGVDLSFQRVYRDMGPLDSIIQVAGRCNRHSEYGVLGGEMQLLHLEKDGKEYCQKVYDSYILQKTKAALRDRDCLESSDFPELIHNYYLSLEFEAEAQALLNAIKELNYDQEYRGQLPIDRFRLIENEYATCTLYILLDDKAQKAMDELQQAKQVLKLKDKLDPMTESQARLHLKQSYHKLTSYQLSLSPSDLKHYNNSMSFFNKLDEDDKENKYVYYVPFEHKEKAYNKETGFILEPIDSGSALSL